MKKGMLSDYFVGIAAKRLSAVEADLAVSNQHELNGVTALKNIFGDEKTTIKAKFLYIDDEEPKVFDVEQHLTWYDAREQHPTRSEYRLYISSTEFIGEFHQGDLIIVGKLTDGSAILLAAKAGTTVENQVRWLFDLGSLDENFEVKKTEDNDMKLGFASKFILEELGIEIEEKETDYLEIMLKKFGGEFPTTRIFSQFARDTLKDVIPDVSNVDNVLMEWLEQEERLFRQLEKHFVVQKLEKGFDNNVDNFVQYSLSIQNRRKARIGRALENHVEEIFSRLNVRHDRGKATENKTEPDFIFPGISEYHDKKFPVSKLNMLGCKSTCKDRWRQVLSEADRIENKHLLTLEPSISESQTLEMQSKKLNLVIPFSIHQTYKVAQRSWLMSVGDFVGMIINKQ